MEPGAVPWGKRVIKAPGAGSGVRQLCPILAGPVAAPHRARLWGTGSSPQRKTGGPSSPQEGDQPLVILMPMTLEPCTKSHKAGEVNESYLSENPRRHQRMVTPRKLAEKEKRKETKGVCPWLWKHPRKLVELPRLCHRITFITDNTIGTDKKPVTERLQNSPLGFSARRGLRAGGSRALVA